MAKRRMFSTDVVDTDTFMDMPLSAQALYFHLGMRADDDGFVGRMKRIQSEIGASADDCKILEAKGYLIRFESGVVVIRHWRLSNYLRNDRYKPTAFQNEKKLFQTQYGGYVERLDEGAFASGIPAENQVETNGIPSVYQMDTQQNITEHITEHNVYITSPNGEVCACTREAEENTVTEGASPAENKSVNSCESSVDNVGDRASMGEGASPAENKPVNSCAGSVDNSGHQASVGEGGSPAEEPVNNRVPPCPFEKIKALYNETCVSLPQIQSMSGKRRVSVGARWRENPDMEVFRRLFEAAEKSAFLCGKNTRNWNATFDWLMKATNMAKVIEGNYADKEPRGGLSAPPQNGALAALARMREECAE